MGKLWATPSPQRTKSPLKSNTQNPQTLKTNQPLQNINNHPHLHPHCNTYNPCIVCGTNTQPTQKPQQENSPNKKNNQTQTPQCSVQHFNAHTHTKRKNNPPHNPKHGTRHHKPTHPKKNKPTNTLLINCRINA
jgi:hypothetical protein